MASHRMETSISRYTDETIGATVGRHKSSGIRVSLNMLLSTDLECALAITSVCERNRQLL